MSGVRRFRPPLWAWAATVPLAALLAGLGTWQVQRGQLKELWLAQWQAAAIAAPLDLGRAGAPRADAFPRVAAEGHYDARQLLLDNQSHAGRPGYHAWTPLALADGTLQLVDRGWLPQDPDRRVLPDVGVNLAPRRVTGVLRPLPEPGLRLSASNCAGAAWPRVVQYPTDQDLACLFRGRVRPGVLLLDADAADGYVRDWSAALAAVPPARHYGYALQWYALCATLLVLFVLLNFRKTP